MIMTYFALLNLLVHALLVLVIGSLEFLKLFLIRLGNGLEAFNLLPHILKLAVLDIEFPLEIRNFKLQILHNVLFFLLSWSRGSRLLLVNRQLLVGSLKVNGKLIDTGLKVIAASLRGNKFLLSGGKLGVEFIVTFSGLLLVVFATDEALLGRFDFLVESTLSSLKFALELLRLRNQASSRLRIGPLVLTLDGLQVGNQGIETCALLREGLVVLRQTLLDALPQSLLSLELVALRANAFQHRVLFHEFLHGLLDLEILLGLSLVHLGQPFLELLVLGLEHGEVTVEHFVAFCRFISMRKLLPQERVPYRKPSPAESSISRR
jgi:hypothetical protein